MAVSKTEEFNKTHIVKALSHPARINILKVLTDLDSCVLRSKVELLSQSTVSQYLKELKRVGLMPGEIEGPKIC